MFTTDNTIKVLIGKDIEKTATPSIDPQSASYIADGEIVILTSNATTDVGEEVNPGTALDREYVRFVQRSGDTLNYSPRIKVANLLKTTARLSAAAAEQVDYIGYNLTSGSIEELNNNQYLLHITYKHDDKIWSEQLNKRTYCYYSDTSATQQEVARSFVKQINMDLYTSVKAEMIFNTGTETPLAAGTISAIHGSATVVMSGAGGVVQGDYLRVAGAGATNAVYYVTAVSGSNVTLETPFQGTTGAALASVRVTAGVTNVGIRLTGLAITYKPKGIAPYNKVKFETAIANFGSTTITNSTVMSWGTGVYEQVADMEWFALGGDGIRNFMWHPIPDGRTDAVSGTYYKTLTFEYYNDDDRYVVSGTKPSKGLVYIFWACSGGVGTDPANTAYSTFIDAWNLYVPTKFEFVP
jgi:hypothetical protein